VIGGEEEHDGDEGDWYEEDGFDDGQDEAESEAEEADAELLGCPECGAMVYEETQRCPQCGEWIMPLAAASRPGRMWLVVVVLAIVALVAWMLRGWW